MFYRRRADVFTPWTAVVRARTVELLVGVVEVMSHVVELSGEVPAQLMTCVRRQARLHLPRTARHGGHLPVP